MQLVENYPIDEIKPAKYNPRSISPEAFEKLKMSLSYGICKPLIINKQNVIIAGHQRAKAAKAIGLKTVPVFISEKKIPLSHEIQFNLVHNRLENELGLVKILNADEIPGGCFYRIEPDRISVSQFDSPAYIVEAKKLLLQYGEYGSIIISSDGTVVHNVDYAVACKHLAISPLVYKLEDQNRVNLLLQQYGIYDFTNIPNHEYAQTLVQPNRTDSAAWSYLYETYVIPKIDKSLKILDFGAGKGYYYRKLKNEGYNISAYEPFPRRKKENAIDVKQVITYIEDVYSKLLMQGLFDVVVLDSVLNSVTNDVLQEYVLASCNSLLSPNGVLFL